MSGTDSDSIQSVFEAHRIGKPVRVVPLLGSKVTLFCNFHCNNFLVHKNSAFDIHYINR